MEKKIQLCDDDYINFCEYYNKKNRIQNNSTIGFIVSLMPSFYILCFINKIYDNLIEIIGYTIVILFFIWYFWQINSNLNENKNRKKLKKVNYFENITEDIEIKIEEDKIIEKSKDSITYVNKEWVKECVIYKDTIFLLNNRNAAVILPRRYFTEEEIEKIINTFKSINQ